MTRRYCWRVGIAWEQEEGTKCDECGTPWDRMHIDVYETCGAYVPEKNDRYGHHCTLPPGHEGPHRWEE